MTAAGRLRRSVLVALVAAVALTVVAATYLAIRQAPSSDEVHTLAQTRDATLDTWRAANRLSSVPPAYYLSAWALGRTASSLGVSALVLLRAVSILGWAAAGLCLGLVVARRGAGWASVFVAGAGATASGLVGQSFASRPYGVVMGATALASLLWDRSLVRPRPWLAVAIGASLVVAASFHYAAVTAVPCFLVAELVARRRDASRSWAFPALMVVAVVPVLLLQSSIRRSIDEEDARVHYVSPASYPAFFASTLRPVAVAVAVVALAAGVWALVRLALGRRTSPDAAASPRPGPSELVGWSRAQATALVGRPLVLLSLLLALAVPAQVVVITSLTSGDYLHRYAMVAILGMVLVASGVVLAGERAGSWWPPFAAAAVALAVPLAVVAAQRETPTRHEVDRVADESHLADTSGPLLVFDPYVYGLLLETSSPDVGRRLVLVGPSTVVGMGPRYDLSGPPRRDGRPVRAFLLMDDLGLDALADRGRVTDVRRLGTAPFRDGAATRSLTGAMVTVVPS